MRSKIVGCVAILVLLQACSNHKSKPSTTAGGLDGPTPGPIIDTGGGAGSTELTYNYDEIAVPTSTPVDDDQLDNRFFAKTRSAFLVDSASKKVHGLKKGRVLTYTFDDGEWFSVTVGDYKTQVVWTCSHAGGKPNVTLKAGSSNLIPACMTTKNGARKVSKVETDTPKKTGDIFILDSQK